MLSMIRMHPRPLSSLLCCTLYLVSWSQGNSSRCIIQKRATPTLKGLLPFSRSLTAEIAYFDGKSVRPFLCQLLPGMRIQHACQPQSSRFSLVLSLTTSRGCCLHGDKSGSQLGITID
jgi:hypothetical protein